MDCRHRQITEIGSKLITGSLFFSLLTTAFTLISCGGGAAPPSPPTPDFSISISPSSVSSQVGTTTSPLTISVNAQNGFSSPVNIRLQGIPEGVTTSPSSPFSVGAGASQSLTFSVSGSAAVGTSSITVLATSGTASHAAQIMVTAEATVRTYQSGTVLYLESGTAADTARVGLETTWGGSIVEASLNGTNFVNAADTGREVQPALYDGNFQYIAGVWGWNPVLAGDQYSHGTPTLAQILTSDSLFIEAQPLQWHPDDKGGGPGQPVKGDVIVEQTITAVTSQPHTFKAHYKITHLGNDLHANSGQEFPAVYVNRAYNRFIYYGGTAPWTNGAVSVTQFQQLGTLGFNLYVPEQWGAHVDAQNMGLTVYVPSQYPYVFGFDSPNETNYFAPITTMTIGPNFVFESDIYLIAGDYQTARQIVYQLHQNLGALDISTPLGASDQPSPGSTVGGVTAIDGWAFDNVKVAKVEILVDGVADGIASYGSPRPDVADTYPNALTNIGYSYSLDTTKYGNGPHSLNVRVTDSNGNVAVFADIQVTVSN